MKSPTPLSSYLRLPALALASLALPLGLAACGEEGVSVDAEDTAGAAQALIDGGDTLEGAGEGAEGADDEAALEEADPAASCEPGALRARVLARYDEDGDGRLSDEERQAIRDDVEGRPVLERTLARHRALRRAVLHRLRFVYDANDDGHLDDSERLTLRDDLIARCEVRRAQILERYDLDGSGDLDEAERTELREDVRARILERRREILERFDANGDGALDLEERVALRQAVRDREAELRAALKERFDVNADGVLDDEERAALREHLRQRIRLELPAEEAPPLTP